MNTAVRIRRSLDFGIEWSLDSGNSIKLLEPKNSRLNKRDTLKEKLATPRGILHLPGNQKPGGLKRFEPSKPLVCFVEHYWEVAWVDQATVDRETVPYPSVHLTFESGNSRIHGVHRKKFSRAIEGTGRVLGVKFRPGGFRAFLDKSLSELTDKIIEPAQEFGDSFVKMEQEALSFPNAEQSFLLIDRFLQSLNPVSTYELELVGRVIERVEADRTIVRAEQIADEFSIGLRSLQRTFQEFVGVGPKWVIQRFRLIEVTERMRNGESEIDFAALAIELGYSDQAHLIRDFKLFVGVPPGKYHRTLRE